MLRSGTRSIDGSGRPLLRPFPWRATLLALCLVGSFVPLSTRAAATTPLQPPRSQVAQALDQAGAGALPAGYPALAGAPSVPPVLLKAIAWVESGWRQFRAPGLPLVGTGGATGIMQVAACTDGAPDSAVIQQAIAANYLYNIACGARLLSQKWAATPRIGDGDPSIVEHWYYAVWAYNGWGWSNNPNNPRFTRHGTPLTDPATFPYQERVFYLVSHPPRDEAGRPLWPAIAVTLPDRGQIGRDPAAYPDPAQTHRDAPRAVPVQTRAADAVQVEAEFAAPDAVLVTPNALIHREWILHNTGDAFWAGYTWRYSPDDGASIPVTVSVPYAPPLTSVTVSADVVAPAQTGAYSGYWQLFDEAGNALGPRSVISMTVASALPSPSATAPATDTTVPATDTTVPATDTTVIDSTAGLVPGVTPGPVGASALDAGTDNATYVADVTVPDGTVLAPGEHFTKTWEIQNSGTHTWTSQYHWTFEAGAPLGSVRSVAAARVAPKGTALFSVDMVAPQRPGHYHGYWQMTDAAGNVFGSQAWVDVQVQAPGTATPTPSLTVPTVAPQPTLSPTPTASPTPSPVPWFGPAVSRAYFAEGYTGDGYQEYLTLFNPQSHAARVQLTIYRADGATLAVPLRLQGLVRRTLDLNKVVPRSSTALVVAADGPIAVERAQYTANGHVVAGAPLPSRHWYLAEGYVGQGFKDSLRLFNPGAVPASVTIRSYRGDGSVFTSHRTVPGEARLNVLLNDVAMSGASSLDVSSGVPIVVEGIVSAAGSAGPADAMALPSASRHWYFPDGGTSAGNQEYVALYNPDARTATVRLQVVTSDGTMAPYTLHIGSHRRGVYVLNGLITRSGLAAVLQADRAVVAQEVRYMVGGAVSVVDGATAPQTRWALAEGYVGQGFKEWITLLNPGNRTAVVRVQILGPHGRHTVVMRERPHHRDYVDVNALVASGPVSAVITANRPIVAGRTMIFNSSKGLSTTVGVPLSSRG